MNVDEATRQRVRNLTAEKLRADGKPEHEIPQFLEMAEQVAEAILGDEGPKCTIQRVDSGGKTWFEVVDRRATPTVVETIEVKAGDIKGAHDKAVTASQKYGGAKPWGDI